MAHCSVIILSYRLSLFLSLSLSLSLSHLFIILIPYPHPPNCIILATPSCSLSLSFSPSLPLFLFLSSIHYYFYLLYLLGVDKLQSSTAIITNGLKSTILHTLVCVYFDQHHAVVFESRRLPFLLRSYASKPPSSPSIKIHRSQHLGRGFQQLEQLLHARYDCLL